VASFVEKPALGLYLTVDTCTKSGIWNVVALRDDERWVHSDAHVSSSTYEASSVVRDGFSSRFRRPFAALDYETFGTFSSATCLPVLAS
jgi:hypothetical protein